MKNKVLKFSSILASSLIVGCTGATDTKATNATEIKYGKHSASVVEGALLQLDKDSNLRSVKHVTDGGVVTDKSFNQTIFKGLKDFNGSSENNAVIRPNASSPVSAKVSLYKKTFEDTQVIVAGGFQHNDALTKISSDIPKDRGFIYIDGQVKNKQINSIVFNIEQAAFLAGYASANYLNKMKSTYSKDGLKIGAFGGRNFPTVVSFMGGFQQGIAYYNANKSTTDEMVEFVKLGSKVEDYFSASFAVGKGKAIAQKLLSKGADIILPVAGPQTGDTLTAIKEMKSNALVVGVDTDQVKQYESHADRFLTSILKNMDVAVTESLKYIFKENSKSEYGLGKTTVGTLENKLVGVASGGNNKLSESVLDSYLNNTKIMTAAKKATNTFKL